MSHTDAAGTVERYARDTSIAAIGVAASWHLVNLAGLIDGWAGYRRPWVALAGWLIIAVCVVIASIRLWWRGGRAPATPGVLPSVGVVVLLGVTVMVLLAVPPSAVFDPSDWAWSSFGWYAVLLLWHARLRWLLIVLGANAVAALATIDAVGGLDRLALSRFVMVAFSTAAMQLGLAYGARALIGAARQAAYASARQAQLQTARFAADQVHADRQRRYRQIGGAARQLLAGLSTGVLEPSDPVVQDRCALEAARLRRLIAEHDDDPDPLVHELRACADMAERRNVAVTLATVGEVGQVPVHIRRTLIEAPMRLLAAAQSWARVTVVADTVEVEVSVASDGDCAEWAPEHDHYVTVTWSQDGDSRWVRASWRR